MKPPALSLLFLVLLAPTGRAQESPWAQKIFSGYKVHIIANGQVVTDV